MTPFYSTSRLPENYFGSTWAMGRCSGAPRCHNFWIRWPARAACLTLRLCPLRVPTKAICSLRYASGGEIPKSRLSASSWQESRKMVPHARPCLPSRRCHSRDCFSDQHREAPSSSWASRRQERRSCLNEGSFSLTIPVQYGCGVITESDNDRTPIDFYLHGLKKFVLKGVWGDDLVVALPVDYFRITTRRTRPPSSTRNPGRSRIT